MAKVSVIGAGAAGLIFAYAPWEREAVVRRVFADRTFFGSFPQATEPQRSERGAAA